MARPLRFQYPGACYHIMARGDGGKIIFEEDDDRKVFITRLGVDLPSDAIVRSFLKNQIDLLKSFFC